MVHSDDKGLVLPPKIAPIPIVVIPIWDKTQTKSDILGKAKEVVSQIKAETKQNVYLDDRDKRPGQKFYDWERKGIPLRIEIGPRDVLHHRVVAVRRDTGEKVAIALSNLKTGIEELLEDIQSNLYQRARQYQEKNTFQVNSYEKLKKMFLDQGTGFAIGYWCGDPQCEEKLKKETKATIRCILSSELSGEKEKCLVCGKKASKKVLVAKAY